MKKTIHKSKPKGGSNRTKQKVYKINCTTDDIVLIKFISNGKNKQIRSKSLLRKQAIKSYKKNDESINTIIAFQKKYG
jgi:hypothetical protein